MLTSFVNKMWVVFSIRLNFILLSFRSIYIIVWKLLVSVTRLCATAAAMVCLLSNINSQQWYYLFQVWQYVTLMCEGYSWSWLSWSGVYPVGDSNTETVLKGVVWHLFWYIYTTNFCCHLYVLLIINSNVSSANRNLDTLLLTYWS